MAKRPRPNRAEHRMAVELDRLAAFEEFESEIAPALRGAIKAGKSPLDIYKMVQAHAAARQATIALTEKDPAKAMAAIKDILDRTTGKPTERKEIEHKYAKLKDEELDALLLSESQGVDEDDGDTLQ